MTRIFIAPLLVLVVVLSAAARPPRPAASGTLELPATPYRYANVALPAHFTQPGRTDDNTPPDNPLSDDGATLGRVLFYDKRLSANNTTSCASCHVQAHAFADPKPFSRGFHGAVTDRRAMPLVNVRYYPRARFFWDERAGNLEEMVLLPVQSRIEMGQDLSRVVDTIARDATYLRSSRARLAIARLPNSESARRSPSSSDPSCRTSPGMTRGEPAQSRRRPTSTLSRGWRTAARGSEEYENFLAAATRLSRSADIRFRAVSGVVGGMK